MKPEGVYGFQFDSEQSETFLLFGPFYERFSQVCPFYEKISKNGPWARRHGLGAEVKHLGAMDYSAEVDDMVNGVTSKILHLLARHRRSRRWGVNVKFVFSLFFSFIFLTNK
jgi:hypothetical protein